MKLINMLHMCLGHRPQKAGREHAQLHCLSSTCSLYLFTAHLLVCTDYEKTDTLYPVYTLFNLLIGCVHECLCVCRLIKIGYQLLNHAKNMDNVFLCVTFFFDIVLTCVKIRQWSDLISLMFRSDLIPSTFKIKCSWSAYCMDALNSLK